VPRCLAVFVTLIFASHRDSLPVTLSQQCWNASTQPGLSGRVGQLCQWQPLFCQPGLQQNARKGAHSRCLAAGTLSEQGCISDVPCRNVSLHSGMLQSTLPAGTHVILCALVAWCQTHRPRCFRCLVPGQRGSAGALQGRTPKRSAASLPRSQNARPSACIRALPQQVRHRAYEYTGSRCP
jgi:hypothetical protein